MKERKEKKDWLWSVFIGGMICLLLAWLFFPRESKIPTLGNSLSSGPVTIVIDPGHGGKDPGKVGEYGSEEKILNLSIGYFLREFLEAQDIAVLMTREHEEACLPNGTKLEDMKERVRKMNKEEVTLIVSIHQNSFPQENVTGAQVFYSSQSPEGKKLAETIQERLRKLDPKNKRIPKSNDTYYLLLHTKKPTVIVECGFLSNREEAKRLMDPWYQEKIAWEIHLGILSYLHGANCAPPANVIQ